MQHIITVIHIPVVAQSLIPMALTVQQTIEIPRLQFLDKELICPLLVYTGANCAASSWRSTGAALGQGCRARCVHDKCPDPVRRTVQKTVEKSAVAVHQQGCHHPRRCAETGSHGLAVQQTTKFSCCSTLTRAVEVGYACPASSLVLTWRRRSRSHSCNVDAGHYCPHARRYATTGTVAGRDSAVNCKTPPQFALIDWLSFLGPNSRHQGEEGVAGTPGACSQVFCHPICCT